MDEIFREMAAAGVYRLVISKPASKQEPYRKITAEKKKGCFQLSCYTEKQVFHENVPEEALAGRCLELTAGHFMQVNGFSPTAEHMVLISRKGSCTYKVRTAAGKAPESAEHDRKKKYILEESPAAAPLVDMGVFTKEGKVVRSMYDKYRQINRFLEILDDEISRRKPESLNIIDFGCGKSYLTFVVYDYLTRIRGIQTRMIGLDLKADVIQKCNDAAEKYGYRGLEFRLGDINGFEAPFRVDMVITLHACDTATDYALYNAVRWNAEMIFSVPCCQHELNGQMSPQSLSILSRYGIIQERFAALATDAIRGSLLEYRGYRTQLLEFVDFSHTPKNILIRAVRRDVAFRRAGDCALREAEALMKEFGFQPTLYRLLGPHENNL